MKRLYFALLAVLFLAPAVSAQLGDGDIPNSPALVPALMGPAIILAAPPSNAPAVAPCVLVVKESSTEGFYGGLCGITPTCEFAVGDHGAGFYGICVAPVPTPPTTGTCTPSHAAATCPIPASPDALNPPGSSWLFYGYKKTALNPHLTYSTPWGTWTQGVGQEFAPPKYLPWPCRNPNRPWAAAFRGWPLPQGAHCGDSGGYSQRCDTPASWCLSGTTHIYKGP
jgi:hypothetical protein